MNNLKICIFCLCAILLFSCSDNYENFDSKAYIDSDSKLTTYLIQSNASEYSASLKVGVPRPPANEIEFIFKVDESLVATYNNSFADNAVILPSNYYTIPETKVKIVKGTVSSTDIKIEFKNVNQLDRNIVYVLPVTIASAGIELLESARTHYYILKGGALINWAADIEKNNFPVNWGDESLVTNMTEITIEAMLYLRQAEREHSESQIMTFFGTENSFLIRLGDIFEPGQIMVVKGPSGKYPSNLNDRIKAPIGKWFHLAVTHDAQNMIRIYINGELKSTSAAASGTINIATHCYIGKSLNDNRYWPGMITETRVWNTVRTQKEITAEMYSVNANSKGLIAYWKFDEGNGNIITDHSGNNNSITASSNLKWNGVALPK